MRRIAKIALVFFFLFFSRIDLGFCANVIKMAVVESNDTVRPDVFLLGFRKELKNQGINFVLDEYPCELADSMSKVKAGDYSLICTLGNQAARKIISEISDKPVIFAMASDPWENGSLTDSRQDHLNVTGVTSDVDLVRQFKFFKGVFPQAVNIGILYGPKTARRVMQFLSSQRESVVNIILLTVTTATDVPRVLEEISSDQIDILWLVADREIYNSNTLRYLLGYSFEKNVPLISFSLSSVKLGALFGYIYDNSDMGRQVAGVAVRILNGEQPQNIAVAYPEKVDYLINLKSARYFKKEFSSESLSKFKETLE